MPQVIEHEGLVRVVSARTGTHVNLTPREARKRALALTRFADLATDHEFAVQPVEAGLVGPPLSVEDAYGLAASMFWLACQIDGCSNTSVRTVPDEVDEPVSVRVAGEGGVVDVRI